VCSAVPVRAHVPRRVLSSWGDRSGRYVSPNGPRLDRVGSECRRELVAINSEQFGAPRRPDRRTTGVAPSRSSVAVAESRSRLPPCRVPSHDTLGWAPAITRRSTGGRVPGCRRAPVPTRPPARLPVDLQRPDRQRSVFSALAPDTDRLEPSATTSRERSSAGTHPRRVARSVGDGAVRERAVAKDVPRRSDDATVHPGGRNPRPIPRRGAWNATPGSLQRYGCNERRQYATADLRPRTPFERPQLSEADRWSWGDDLLGSSDSTTADTGSCGADPMWVRPTRSPGGGDAHPEPLPSTPLVPAQPRT
jgi:hypothetical protein